MKKLIVVCEEKCQAFGNYLSQLISLNDDTEDAVVGTKDGEVAAQVWLEKDYQANSAQISSAQYLLFIGNDRFMKDIHRHVPIQFSKFGMEYGWLGRQAALYVSKIVSSEEYEDFLAFASENQTNLENYVQSTRKANGMKVNAVRIQGLLDNAQAGAATVKKLVMNKKIEEQQYSCAVMKFYLDALSAFLEMDAD